MAKGTRPKLSDDERKKRSDRMKATNAAKAAAKANDTLTGAPVPAPGDTGAGAIEQTSEAKAVLTVPAGASKRAGIAAVTSIPVAKRGDPVLRAIDSVKLTIDHGFTDGAGRRITIEHRIPPGEWASICRRLGVEDLDGNDISALLSFGKAPQG